MFNLEEFTERLESFLKENSGSVKTGLQDSGVNRNLVDSMKKGSKPSIDKIVKIAECFNISIDYLLGREMFPSSMSDLEKELVKYFRSLDDDGKTAILRAVRNEYQARGSSEQHSRIVSSLRKQDCAEDNKALQR